MIKPMKLVTYIYVSSYHSEGSLTGKGKWLVLHKDAQCVQIEQFAFHLREGP